MLDSIKQKIIDLDYGTNKLDMAILFIPGVSYVVLQIKSADLQQKIKKIFDGYPDAGAMRRSKEGSEFSKVHQWHLFGSVVQVIGLVAIGILFNPIFLLTSLAAMYEAYSAYHGISVNAYYQNSRWNFT